MKNIIKENAEILFLTLGSVSAFVMAMMRSGGFTRRDLAMRCGEGVMCSMLSSGISIGANIWWGWNYELSIPIGTFVGFLGTSFFQTFLKGWIASKANVDLPKKDEDD